MNNIDGEYKGIAGSASAIKWIAITFAALWYSVGGNSPHQSHKVGAICLS